MKINQKQTAIDCYHNHVVPKLSAPECVKIASYVMRKDRVTRGMIAAALGMEKSSVSGRVNDLVAARVLVVLDHKEPCPITGRTVEWLSHSANLKPQLELIA